MSRIGNKAIAIPSGVKVAVDAAGVTVEGKTKLSMPLPPLVAVEVKDGNVHVSMASDDRKASAMQGLTRSLINNMVIGVTTGFKKELQIVGVGYKAQLTGKKLVLNLGFSHTIEFNVPEGVKVTVDGAKITVEGADKQAVGEAAAEIRRFRPPEPYKGKGIRYADERIILKEGKPWVDPGIKELIKWLLRIEIRCARAAISGFVKRFPGPRSARDSVSASPPTTSTVSSSTM